MVNLRSIEKRLRAKGITNVEVTKDKNIFHVLHILSNGSPVPLFKTDNKDELNEYLTVNYGVVEDKKGKGWHETKNPETGVAQRHHDVQVRGKNKEMMDVPIKARNNYVNKQLEYLAEMIEQAKENMAKMLVQAYSTGALPEEYKEDNYLLPKAIITIWGRKENYAPNSPQGKKEVKNLEHFL